jgi:hypothetical protein
MKPKKLMKKFCLLMALIFSGIIGAQLKVSGVCSDDTNGP